MSAPLTFGNYYLTGIYETINGGNKHIIIKGKNNKQQGISCLNDHFETTENGRSCFDELKAQGAKPITLALENKHVEEFVRSKKEHFVLDCIVKHCTTTIIKFGEDKYCLSGMFWNAYRKTNTKMGPKAHLNKLRTSQGQLKGFKNSIARKKLSASYKTRKSHDNLSTGTGKQTGSEGLAGTQKRRSIPTEGNGRNSKQEAELTEAAERKEEKRKEEKRKEEKRKEEKSRDEKRNEEKRIDEKSKEETRKEEKRKEEM
jgi:hypothetical protein